MATNWTPLASAVDEAERQGVVGVSVIAPDGERWERRGSEQFKAASTVKIGIMAEIYRKIDRGELAIDDVHILRAEEKARGSGVLAQMHAGIQLSIGDLLYLMMSISDNTATNLLIDYAGMDEVNATMRDLGMANSNLGRKMLGRPAQEGEQENLATPDDYARAIKAILDGEAASAGSCQAMVATLEQQQNGRRIGRYVPRQEGYSWGSKTGSLEAVCNDVGFIRSPAGTLILAVFVGDVADPVAGEQIIADLARAAMQATGILER